MGLFNLYISRSLLWAALRGGPYSSCTGKAYEPQKSKVPPKVLQQITKGQDSELRKPDSQGPLFASSPPGRPTSLWGCQTLPLEAQPNASSAGKVPGALQPAATLPPLPRRAVTIHLVHAQPGEQMPLAGSLGRAHLLPPHRQKCGHLARWPGTASLPSMGPGTEWRFSVPTVTLSAITTPTTTQLACLHPLLKPESNLRLGVLTSF